MDFLKLSEEEWKKRLSPEQYRILREKGTEPAFCGIDFKGEGVFKCAACKQELFTSKEKFDSGSGWPSFFEAIDEERLLLEKDTSHGMIRTEVMCGRCHSHLGHVFDDGPPPTGKRFCINSLALDFEKE